MLYMLLGFAGCAAVIFFAGQKLSFYGDLISEKKGLGKAFIGLILMASVTSLPELMVGISSSAIIESADLAVGDIMGSCAFNLGILALMDAFVADKKTLFSSASQSHVLIAVLGIILFAFVGFGIFLPEEIVITSWISITSIAFIMIYLVSIRLIYLNEKRLVSVEEAHPDSAHLKDMSLRQIYLRYSLYALVIIVAALALPYFAEQLAVATGLGQSFVGTVFLAASTSLPEVAVSIAAVRMGSIDLAVGNLLGSNLFNIFILAIDDIFYTKGFILKDASEANMISLLSCILMSGIVIAGLTFRAKGKNFLLAWDAFLIFLVYIFNLILLYQQTH